MDMLLLLWKMHTRMKSRHFFDMIAGKKMDIYGFKEDKYILRTIDCIESDGE